MSQPAFAGIGGHQAQCSGKEEWLTPPFIIAALGGWMSFDLDPCAPVKRPWPTAKHHFTIEDNALIQDWRPYRRVWSNPPYTPAKLRRWMARMAAHNCGVSLIFARTETEVWHRFIWPLASGVFFFSGRLNFHNVDGTFALRDDGKPQNAGGPSALCAYGPEDLDVLAGCGLEGKLVPLLFPRYVLAERVVGTWRNEVLSFFLDRRGPVKLDELYRAFACHPKAQTNPHWKAKIRQVLQEAGFFQPVERGIWEMLPA
jgi:hypothetical protein